MSGTIGYQDLTMRNQDPLALEIQATTAVPTPFVLAARITSTPAESRRSGR